MKASDFMDWMRAMDISSVEAGRLLGVHANTITKYRAEGAPTVVALACRALYHRLEPWG